MKKVTKKEIQMIADELIEYGTCFIGTYEVQGQIVFKRYEKVLEEVWDRTDNSIDVWFNYNTGIAYTE